MAPIPLYPSNHKKQKKKDALPGGQVGEIGMGNKIESLV
jgi:hypothetical protein